MNPIRQVEEAAKAQLKKMVDTEVEVVPLIEAIVHQAAQHAFFRGVKSGRVDVSDVRVTISSGGLHLMWSGKGEFDATISWPKFEKAMVEVFVGGFDPDYEALARRFEKLALKVRNAVEEMKVGKRP